MPSGRLPTLRDLHAEGSTFWAACSNRRGGCSHCAAVAIDSLIQHLGWDFAYIAGRDRLRDVLVCSKCGQNRPEIQHHRPSSFVAGQGGHSLSPSGVATPPGSQDMSAAEALAWSREFRKAHPPVPAGGKGRRRWR